MAPEPITKTALYKLGDMNLVVADRSQDIRGRKASIEPVKRWAPSRTSW